VFQPGDLIDGRYEVLGPLGQGGMGYVFRVQDRRLDRVVALKVLRPHLTETDAERFRREIRALSRLNHPAIVSIYDLGQGEHVYFAMELVEGGSFTDLGPFAEDFEPATALLDAAISVAEALSYVHRLGMVHRDITPRNILLDKAGRPKLTDFGLVQLTETSKQLTRTGSTLGTPQYMAPEQATGDSTGAATDLYAFGAVLYRTVTGTAPFEAENDQAIMYQHVYNQAPRAHELHARIPWALSALLARMLAKRPEERPTGAAEVANALRAVRAHIRSETTHQPHGGGARRGFYPSALAEPAQMRLDWQVHLDEGPQWPTGLAGSEGSVLIGLRSDALVALRPADGQTLQRIELSDEVTSTPLVQRGRLWITTRDGSLSAFTYPQGALAWKDPTAEAIGLAQLGRDVLISCRSGTIERWGSGPTEVRWRAELDAPATTPPTVAGNLVVSTTESGWLHAVSAENGSARFKVEVGAMVAPVVASDRLLLLATRSGELHAFDLQLHEVLWSFDLAGECWAPPVVAGTMLFVATWGEALHAISLKTGDELWTYRLSHPVTAAPMVSGGALYITTEGGELIALQCVDGRELFRTQVATGAIQAGPLWVGGRLLVASVDGTISAFRDRQSPTEA
jgi:serine/threonine protein kinase